MRCLVCLQFNASYPRSLIVYLGPQAYEEAVSFANWDTLWYTRGFPSMDAERSRRHASRVLTYPLTIGSVLHQHSSLTLNNQRLTPEGSRSLAGKPITQLLTTRTKTLSQLFGPLCMSTQAAQIQRKLGPQNRKCEYSSLVPAMNQRSRRTYGNSCACYSRPVISISTLLVLKSPCPSRPRPRPRRRHPLLLHLPRHHLRRNLLRSLRDLNHSTCPTSTSPPRPLPSRA